MTMNSSTVIRPMIPAVTLFSTDSAPSVAPTLRCDSTSSGTGRAPYCS